MISKDKERLQVSVPKTLAKELDEKSKLYGITKSQLVIFMAEAILSYKAGEALGDLIIKAIEGSKKE